MSDLEFYTDQFNRDIRQLKLATSIARTYINLMRNSHSKQELLRNFRHANFWLNDVKYWVKSAKNDRAKVKEINGGNTSNVNS